MEKLGPSYYDQPNHEEETPAKKPTIHRSNKVNRLSGMALAGMMAGAVGADAAAETRAPVNPDSHTRVESSKPVKVARRSAPTFELKQKKLTEDEQEAKFEAEHKLIVELRALIQHDTDAFVLRLKELGPDAPFDSLCEFAQMHPSRFLKELESLQVLVGDKLMYATAAVKRADPMTVAIWLHKQGGLEFINWALEAPSAHSHYQDLARPLLVHPAPDEVEKQFAGETTEEKDKRVLKLRMSDMDAFVRELKQQVGGPILPESMNVFITKHTERFLAEFESFEKLSALERIHMLDMAFDHLDIITVAKWLEQSKDTMAKLKKEFGSPASEEDAEASYEHGKLEEWQYYPSKDVATLMTAYFLKHDGRAVQWSEVVGDRAVFGIAHALLRFPVVADWVNKQTKASDVVGLPKALGMLRWRKDPWATGSYKTIHTPDFSKDVAAWANTHGVKNPYLLARELVLLAEDLALRDVDFTAGNEALEQAVKESIERLEKGREQLDQHDVVQRDVTVVVSGDTVENKTGKVVYDMQDKAFAELEKAHQEKHPNGNATFQYLRVPTGVAGEVAEEHIRLAHAQLMTYLESPGKERTVIMSAHGSDKSIHLVGAPVTSSQYLEDLGHATGPEMDADFDRQHAIETTLSIDDLVAAFKKRLAHPEVAAQYAAGKPDILVFHQCRSFNFAQNLYKALQAENLPLPIIIASGERNANTLYYSARGKRDASSADFSDILAKYTKSSGLKGLVNDARVIDTDGGTPTIIFLPDENNRPVQLSSVGSVGGSAPA